MIHQNASKLFKRVTQVCNCLLIGFQAEDVRKENVVVEAYVVCWLRLPKADSEPGSGGGPTFTLTNGDEKL